MHFQDTKNYLLLITVLITIRKTLFVEMDMKIVIDAWLERNDPQIRFLDGETSMPLMHWGSALTRYLIERGELNLEELRNRADGGLPSIYEFLSSLPNTMSTSR